MKQIDVAVAVIHYKNKYLLGYRNAQQHQGNRFEFVGGKVEANETAKQALVREVYEEVGFEINKDSVINRLGILRHEYLDSQDPNNSKQVCLHVYRVSLTAAQYELFIAKNIGREGQPLQWVNKQELIAGHYTLPDANKTILQWLSLPNIISITLDTNQINSSNNSHHEGVSRPCPSLNDKLIKEWVDFHNQRLVSEACVYVRLKQLSLDQQASVLHQLITARPDLKLIINTELAQYLQRKNSLPIQVIAQHLSESALDSLFIKSTLKSSQPNCGQNILHKDKIKDLANGLCLPITVSCHRLNSIKKVNQLAKYLIHTLSHSVSKEARSDQYECESKSIIAGIFISPVNKTQTHPDAQNLGWKAFEKLASQSEVPVIGLGGLSPEDIDIARFYGADKVAGIRRFLVRNAH